MGILRFAHATKNLHLLTFYFCISIQFSASGVSPFLYPSKFFVRNYRRTLNFHLDLLEGEAQSNDSGALIWDAGNVLSEYLSCNAAQVSGKRILELGSGTGVVGLTAASLGAADVILTDKPELMQLLEQNIEANDLTSNARATPLLWGEDVATACDDAVLKADIIIGSDLLYAPESFELLLDTMLQVCESHDTQVWLAYPIRFTEKVFFDQAREYFYELEPPYEMDSGVFLSRLQKRADE